MKAQSDLLYILVTCMIIAVVVILGAMLMGKAKPILDAMSPVNSPEYNVTTATTTAATVTLTTTWDQGFAVLFVLMVAASMILGALLPTNPIFFIPFIFVLILITVITAIMSNIWSAIAYDPTMASTTAQFTFIPFIMNNLPVLTAGLGFMMAIVVYTSFVRR